MKKQLGFFVDARRCIDCFSCAMACKNQYHQPAGVKWRDVFPKDEEFYPHLESAHLTLACNHCENPSCLPVCPVEAISKREKDGVVVLDQEECSDCGNCIEACPYDAPKRNSKVEKAEKCNFCWQRLDAGKQAACVQGCPTKALQMVDLSTFDEPDTRRYIAGFPRLTRLNPSIRFRPPRKTKMVKRQTT